MQSRLESISSLRSLSSGLISRKAVNYYVTATRASSLHVVVVSIGRFACAEGGRQEGGNYNRKARAHASSAGRWRYSCVGVSVLTASTTSSPSSPFRSASRPWRRGTRQHMQHRRNSPWNPPALDLDWNTGLAGSGHLQLACRLETSQSYTTQTRPRQQRVHHDTCFAQSRNTYSPEALWR